MLKFIDPNNEFKLETKKKGLFNPKSNILYPLYDGVIDLRPNSFDFKQKNNEDKIHLGKKINKNDIIFKIFEKKLGHIKTFNEDWLPKIVELAKNKKTFLEIGGGFCYVSSIVKNKIPHLVVCASDISLNYLKNKSKPLADGFFNLRPDYFVAMDSENIPLENNSLDILYCASSMHHFSSVKKFLKEVNRVLKSDGVLIALDTADPYFNNKIKHKKIKRAKINDIFEKSYTIFDWERIVKNTDFKVKYYIYQKKYQKHQTFLKIVNSRIPIKVLVSNRHF